MKKNFSKYKLIILTSFTCKVELGGIESLAPCAPYAYSGFIVNIDLSPFLMVATPKSHPLITLPCPIRNSNGWSRSPTAEKKEKGTQEIERK